MEERDSITEIDPSLGLTDEQVQSRTPAGKPVYSGKSEKEIVLTHCFTFFNLIFVILAVMLVVGGSSPLNMGFLVVAVINTVIGIIQEIRAKRAVERLTLVAERPVAVIRSGARQEISPEAIVKDDIAEFASGDTLPADGILRSGEMWVDESLLTGEADAVTKTPGDEVKSGSAILSGRGRVQFTAVGGDSFAAQLSREAQKNPSAKKSEMMRSLDRLILFVGIALVPVGIILFYQEFCVLKLGLESSVEGTVAALVGMIPEGLYLLTSIAMAASAVKLSRKKVLVQDMNCIETLARVDVLCVDKTGTITKGEPAVTDIIPEDGVSSDELLRYAYSLEVKSEHPLAKAVVREGEKQGVKACDTTDFAAAPGNGLSAKSGGKTYTGGNIAYIGKTAKISEKAKNTASELAKTGKTPLFFAEDDKLLGVIAVADVIKDDSRQAINELKGMGIRVVMLTGDNAATAQAIGREAGVDDVISDVLPDGKAKVIRELKREGKVAMVGDGINDAPALTEADIGIAIGAGTDVAIDAADVVLMNSKLTDASAAIRLSRGTIRNIHENLFWAFIYNIIGIPLAAGVFIKVLGWQLNPMFGAAAMSLSSFCVVTNALRLNLLKIHDPKHDHKMRKKLQKAAESGEKTKMTIKIQGMMCSHCEATVKKALEEVPGVISATADHEKGVAEVETDGSADPKAMKKAIEKAGYKAV